MLTFKKKSVSSLPVTLVITKINNNNNNNNNNKSSMNVKFHFYKKIARVGIYYFHTYIHTSDTNLNGIWILYKIINVKKESFIKILILKKEFSQDLSIPFT